MKSEIQKFFDQKSVFITGGTGFIGILLIEKLLRSCPDIGRIYVLIREKRSVKSEDRLNQLFNNTVFDKLKKMSPSRLEKITLVNGNLEMEKLGLSSNDWDCLVENVECIFHVGAQVRYICKLSAMLKSNVFGTGEVVRLAKEAKKLQCFVYVSSTYSQCTKSIVEEKTYESEVTSEDLLQLQKNLGAKFDEIESAFLGDFPNTYTYSKFLAEDFLRRNALDIPLGIIRPAIVCQTVHEPVAGWADSQHLQFTHLFSFYSIGILHVFSSNPKAVVDLIPADYVVNNIIAIAWKIGSSWKPKQDHVEVFNCGSGHCNPITTGQFASLLKKYSEKYLSNNRIWTPFIFVNLSRFHSLLLYFLQLPHIVVMDWIGCVFGKPKTWLKMYQKAYTLYSVCFHFLSTSWLFKTDNNLRLWNELDEQDQKIFNFDVNSMEWEFVVSTFVKGFRKYILQENEDTFIPSAQKKQFFLKVAHCAFIFIFTIVCIALVLVYWFLHFLYERTIV